MKRMKIPDGAEFIIDRLNREGYRADVVGGSVRDFLRGFGADDFDITTDAVPERLEEIFSDMRTVRTGIKHGTLTVIVDNTPYEVTTYRVDGAYTDNRHPDSVNFTGNLSEDLSRRDFTMNAIAYNPNDGYTDIFFGIDDIENRVIRAVGDPVRRFSEDALRILRAIRFASVLEFRIEEETKRAAKELKDLLLKVSRERIFTEWKKLLSGAGAFCVIKEYLPVISVFFPELREIDPKNEEYFKKCSARDRELYLFSLASYDDSDRLYSEAMQRLRSDNKRRIFGERVLSYIKSKLENDREIRELLLKIGREEMISLAKVKILRGDIDEARLSDIEKIISDQTVFTVSDLSVSGKDLISLGFSGEAIGVILGKILYSVGVGDVRNDKDSIIKFVTEI